MNPTGHPKGLYLLFFTEMWERFSYYGMRAIFTLFMIKALLFDKALASEIYGSYTGLVYLTPLIGGYVADRYWGNRRAILAGGILMAIGHFCMFLSAANYSDIAFAQPMLFLGLGFLIFGNGFFKPNTSTMVGQLYPEGDQRIDAAFTIFYMGINLGAFFSPLVCGTLGEKIAFKWGFFAAGIGMLIGVLLFLAQKNKYLVTDKGEPIGMPSKKLDTKNIAYLVGSILLIFFLLNFKSMFNVDTDIIGYFIFGSMIIVPAIIISDKSLTSTEKSRIWVIFILAFFVIFFWGAFEQAGASLTIFADKQTDRHIFGWEMPASYFQSVNPLSIIVLAPLFSAMWIKLGNRNMEPATPRKMALGLSLVALGYVLIAFAVKGVDASTKINMFWLFSLYVVHTMGELCLSPIGLSMVAKLSPARFSSLLMGTWFLANAAANKFAGTLSELIPSESNPTTSFVGFQITNLYEFFLVFIIMCGVAAGILFLISGKLQKMMGGIK